MAWRNPWFDPAQPHHLPDGFRNFSPVGHQPGDVQRWQEERKAQGLPHPPQNGYEAFTRQWWQRAEIRGEEDGLWWLGHASLLLRINGLYILTDPVFSRRASPRNFTDRCAGRRRRFGLRICLPSTPFLFPITIMTIWT